MTGKKLLAMILALMMAVAYVPAMAETGSSAVNGFGGSVTVELTVENGKVTGVTITGEGETPAVGGQAINTLQAAMLESGSIEVEAVAGATVTSNAVIAAANQAYNAATGAEAAEVKMAPGTYTASAMGFNHVMPIELNVTVSETAIESIEVNHNNRFETPSKLKSASQIIPRIIEAQSYGVDVICGATSSSNAIRTAVADALAQALEAGGSSKDALLAFNKTVEVPASEETIDVDVVVVGLGGSGCYAALRTAETMNGIDAEHVSVLSIDKAGNYGGSTALTSGIFSVNPKTFTERYNNGEDFLDKEALKASWIEYTYGDMKEDVLDVLLDNSGAAVDWAVGYGLDLVEPVASLDGAYDFRVNYSFAPLTNGRISDEDLNGYFDGLMQSYVNYGGQYMLETEATDLIYDAERKAITGVKAYNKYTNTTYTINARAVILATGGFAGSAEMETKYLSNEYFPLSGDWPIIGTVQNDGRMMQSAIDLGAGTYCIGMVPACHCFGTMGWLTNYPLHALEGEKTIYSANDAYWSEGDLPMMLLFSADHLALNNAGKRFVNETTLCDFNAWKGGPNITVLVTEDQIREVAENGLNFMPANYIGLLLNMDILNGKSPIPNGVALSNAFEVMESAIAAGFVDKADSIEELAGKIGFDAAELKAEVDAYNALCESGVDSQFGKDASALVKIEGTVYAIHCGMYEYGTCAGLDINANMQVLDTNGEVITGLYAIGSDSEGVLFTDKKAYVTYGGVDNGWVLTSAYKTGEFVVNELMAR